MGREALLHTLKKYENVEQTTENSLQQPDPSDLQTIENDIDRVDYKFSRAYKSVLIAKLYAFILQQLLVQLPFSYLQGMAEVVSMIMDAYLVDKALALREKHKDMESVFVDQPRWKDINEDEKQLFGKFCQSNSQLITSLRSAVLGVLRNKYLPLIRDDFTLYKRYNQVFVQFMKSKYGVELEGPKSLVFMNHILTFFQRISGNEKTAFGILNLILNGESSIVFSILAVFFEEAKNFQEFGMQANENEARKTMILDFDEHKSKEILKVDEEFIDMKYDMDHGTASSGFYFFGVAASLLAAAFFYNVYKYRERE